MRPFAAESNLEWKPSPDVEGVMIGVARKDGPTVGIIGGVHGDEPAGIEVARSIPHQLSVDRGRVIVMLGNLRAIANGTRQTEGGDNLNRSFRPLTDDEKLRSDLPYELGRCQELMGYIDQCDGGIFDIHEYEDPHGKPFIICERPSLAIAKQIGAPVVAFGFAEAEPGGSDGYGHSIGIPAICYEIGAMGKQYTPNNVRFGKRTVSRFLGAGALTNEIMPPLYDDPLLVQVDGSSPHIRAGDTFEFERTFTSFEQLRRGQLVATDGGIPIRADTERDQVILFPKPTPPIKGREAFELGWIVSG